MNLYKLDVLLYKHFLPHFHYNKDWNDSNISLFDWTRLSSYPTSIITRIETWMARQHNSRPQTSYPTSIITRIETYKNVRIANF